jgi:hypothetical protein
MAHSSNLLHTHRSPEVAFDFISDFRHAALWDPNTRRVTKLTDGPIARGTSFLLQAGFIGTKLEFPYEIELFDRPNRVVFSGSTRWARYREQVSFRPDASGTAIEYAADFFLSSFLSLGNPLLSLVYQRIGDSATSGIVAALDRNSLRAHG